MLIACIIAYQEERMLPGCLESLAGQVERVVVVDGAYAAFPHRAPWSTDATRAVAEAYGAEWIECPEAWSGRRAWRDQMEKRSAYLVGNEGDRYLRIDADERLVGSLAGLEAGVDYALRCYWEGGSLQPWVPCLFEQRGEMEYKGAHCALWRDGEMVSRLADVQQWPEARLVHLKRYRSVERVTAKRAYYARQTAQEWAFRVQWGV